MFPTDWTFAYLQERIDEINKANGIK